MDRLRPLGDEDTNRTIESTFVPDEDGRFLLDADAERLVDAVIESGATLSAVASQLLEAIAGSAGTRPDLALKVCRSVLRLSGDMSKASHSLNSVAASLTNIAITLHRQDQFRREGLELIEELLARGFGEAAAALELLDRKPNQKFIGLPPMRSPRRRPKRKG